MDVGWTEYAVLWTNFLGLNWETGIEISLFWETKYKIRDLHLFSQTKVLFGLFIYKIHAGDSL